MLQSHKAGVSKSMVMLAITLLIASLNLALGSTPLTAPSVSKKRVRIKQAYSTSNIYTAELKLTQDGVLDASQKNGFCDAMITSLQPSIAATLTCEVLSQYVSNAKKKKIIVQFQVSVTSSDAALVNGANQKIVDALNAEFFVADLLVTLNNNNVPATKFTLESFSSPVASPPTPAPTTKPTLAPTKKPTQAPLASTANTYISEMRWSQSGFMTEAQKNAFCVSMVTILVIPGATLNCIVLGQTSGGTDNGVYILNVQYTISVSSADSNVIANASQTIISMLNDTFKIGELLSALNLLGVPASGIALKSFSTPVTPSPTLAPTKKPNTGCSGFTTNKKKCNKQACCKFKNGVCKDGTCDPCRPLKKNDCKSTNCCKYKKNKDRCKFNESKEGCVLAKE